MAEYCWAVSAERSSQHSFSDSHTTIGRENLPQIHLGRDQQRKEDWSNLKSIRSQGVFFLFNRRYYDEGHIGDSASTRCHPCRRHRSLTRGGLDWHAKITS